MFSQGCGRVKKCCRRVSAGLWESEKMLPLPSRMAAAVAKMDTQRSWPRELRVPLFYRQWTVKHGEADYFGAGYMRSVVRSLRSEEEGANGVDFATFLPLAGKDPRPFICQWMSVCGDGFTGSELSQDNHAAGFSVSMEELQFDPR